jgi:carbamoyltransferase
MSVILGINSFHAGASAALIVDGKIIHAIAEERLNRIKYYAGFPVSAIKACLDWAGLDVTDVDHVAVGRDAGANLQKKAEYVIRHPTLLANLMKIKSARQGLDDLKGLFAKHYGVPVERMRFDQHNVEHHLAHTASAYFVSGWDHAAGITIDGSGDFVTCMMSACQGRDIQPVHRIYVPNSLGSFYMMICQFIGYTKYGDEGKVMGMAPLGQDTYRDAFAEMIAFDKGQIKLSPKYFLPFGTNQGMTIDAKGQMVVRRHYSDYMIKRFGPPRSPYSDITQRDMDLAFGLQRRFEEIYFQLLNHLYDLVPDTKVVMAGGCVLNSVANGKLFAHTPFRETVIQPAAGDEGLALGAALYVSHAVLGEGDNQPMAHAYLGREYPEHEIERLLKGEGVHYVRLESEELIHRTTEEIANGKVVGWYQGRSEWGPRALGNRSIICHPGYEGMKDILNARIKRREWFRPFAPVVLQERLADVFEHDYPSPFMLHVYKIREEWREKLSAVNHVDNTGRLQTISRQQNPMYYDLIKAFEAKTGLPVLLNTSFNENEPIVERPEEAVSCFLRTKMDVLVAGPFLCRKLDQERAVHNG